MKYIKYSILRIPFISYLARIFIYTYRLPKFMDAISAHQHKTRMKIEKVNDNTNTALANINMIASMNESNATQLRYLNNRFNSLRKPLIQHSSDSSSNNKQYFADNHLLDDFYLEFENRFRGKESEITTRLKEYIPMLSRLKAQSAEFPILDIGCGRGELLSLLSSKKIRAIGIDINAAMVNECKNKGFEVIEGNAIKYLSNSKPESFSAITGFHIVEHIEFPELLTLFAQCYKSIIDSGFVLFETPNPENIFVGANTFYYDPSHLKPLPPDLLKFAMETVGFSKVEVKYLHPEIENKAKDPIRSEIHRRLFGPRDYAVIARK